MHQYGIELVRIKSASTNEEANINTFKDIYLQTESAEQLFNSFRLRSPQTSTTFASPAVSRRSQQRSVLVYNFDVGDMERSHAAVENSATQSGLGER